MFDLSLKMIRKNTEISRKKLDHDGSGSQINLDLSGSQGYGSDLRKNQNLQLDNHTEIYKELLSSNL